MSCPPAQSRVDVSLSLACSRKASSDEETPRKSHTVRSVITMCGRYLRTLESKRAAATMVRPPRDVCSSTSMSHAGSAFCSICCSTVAQRSFVHGRAHCRPSSLPPQFIWPCVIEQPMASTRSVLRGKAEAPKAAVQRPRCQRSREVSPTLARAARWLTLRLDSSPTSARWEASRAEHRARPGRCFGMSMLLASRHLPRLTRHAMAADRLLRPHGRHPSVQGQEVAVPEEAADRHCYRT